MARASLTQAEFDFVRQLEWEEMTEAQLAKAREVWSRGEAVQDLADPRVWSVRSYSCAGGKKRHHVVLKSDHGYPRFTCTCPHGQRARWASCWHARIVARIYRVMVDQRKQQLKEERIREYSKRRREQTP